MKILELRFKNLNSLYGEWFIDFTDPEYISNGIFALTGPTGAGKSTILDAICLALYGSTPRLGKITKSGNEIMSRQTGECYSEVLFESQEGRYRCHWGQHRARKKADGNLIEARHEISDALTGKPIETKKSLVLGIVEEKTGMDYDRFTRSILLAQGDFDTFLKANVEQKSKILEQITGTQIYTEISKCVHERQRDEREKLTILEAETRGIKILTSDEETEIRENLQEKQEQETKISETLNQTKTAITWLTGIDETKKEIIKLSEKLDQLQIKRQSFAPDVERLNQANNAAEIEGTYATLSEVRKQQEIDKNEIKIETDKLGKLKIFAKQKLAVLKAAELNKHQTKEQLKKMVPLIRKVRALDQELSEKKKVLLSVEKDCRGEAAQIEENKHLKLSQKTKHQQIKNKLIVVKKYLKVHAGDDRLMSGFEGIKEQLGSLGLKQNEISSNLDEEQKLKQALKKATQKHKDLKEQFNTRKKTLENIVKPLKLKKNDLASLLGERHLREYRAEKETLLREMAFHARIAELDQQRSKLEDDKPCPLCGSLEHPFAKNNIPIPDETDQRIEALSEIILNADKLETKIKEIEAKEKIAQNKLIEYDKRQTTAANEKHALETSIGSLTDTRQKLQIDFITLKNVILSKLKPLGIKEVSDSDVTLLIETLQKRRDKWQDNLNQKQAMEKQIAGLDSKLKTIDAVIETRSKVLDEKKIASKTVARKLENKDSERRELFGTKNPDTEEARLNKERTKSEKKKEDAKSAHHQEQQNLDLTKSAISTLKQRIDSRSQDLNMLESEFTGYIKAAGFGNEKEFVDARLSPSDRKKLAEQLKNFDNQLTDLKVRKKDRKDRLHSELDKKVTDSRLIELEPQLKTYEKKLKQQRDLIAHLEYKLSGNLEAKALISEKQKKIEAQQKECHRWERLHGLIGSADGKKYRNFAQGLTFELMVAHANRQLEKMTDRYLLLRDKRKPLDLNVMDNYQAGEIRSTRNLSGGESFIISLSLALGLSKMASRKVRVDSLFLDEGFGTLDEDALENALEALSGLHQDGKLIGVISHIPALKDRISTQIMINPLSGGKSTITGPGCRKMLDQQS